MEALRDVPAERGRAMLVPTAVSDSLFVGLPRTKALAMTVFNKRISMRTACRYNKRPRRSGVVSLYLLNQRRLSALLLANEEDNACCQYHYAEHDEENVLFLTGLGVGSGTTLGRSGSSGGRLAGSRSAGRTAGRLAGRITGSRTAALACGQRGLERYRLLQPA